MLLLQHLDHGRVVDVRDEAEPAAAARLVVEHELHVAERAVLLEVAAQVGLRGLARQAPHEEPRLLRVGPDARVPDNADDLQRLTPVYETLPGWQTDITSARKLDDLPPNARAYAGRLSELCECPIEFISVGPDREQTIVLNPDESLLDSLVS